MSKLDTFTFSVGASEREMLIDALDILSPDRPALRRMRDALMRRLNRLAPDPDTRELVAGKMRPAVEEFLDAVMPSLGGAE